MNGKLNYVTLTDLNFQKEVIESLVPTLVVFETDWCGACHIITPILDRLAIDYRDKMKIGKLDFENNKIVPYKYSVYDIPALLFFKNGQLIDLIVGAVSKNILETRLKALLKMDDSLEN